MQALATSRDRPCTHREVLVPEKTRGAVREVHSAQPAATASERVACGGQEPDVGLAPEVLFDPRHGHRGAFGDHARLLIGGHDDTCEVGAGHAPVDFPSDKNRHFTATHEADAPAEVRNHVVVDGWTELENVHAFEKKRPLLREEQGEPRQVRLTCIDFRLSEIGERRERGGDVGTQALRDVETRTELALNGGSARRNPPARGDAWPNAQASTQREVWDLCQQPCATGLREPVPVAPATPSDRLPAASARGAQC